MTTIIIQSIDTIGEAAQEFIAQMGDNKIFAFYGSWELVRLPS